MPTIEQLKKQIQAEELKISKAKKKQDLEFEKAKLSKQLKVLRRSPSTKKNIALAKKTGTQIKKFGGIAGRAILKQAKLIKEQQMREDAAFAQRNKQLSTAAKKTGKKLAKKSRKRTKTVSRGLKSRNQKVSSGFDFF